jgi:hypothetical protein
MSPFHPEGDLAGTSVSFSPSVRKMCCSQIGQDVLRQDAAVLRYAPRVIRTKRAQKSPPFSGRTLDVLAPLHVLVVGYVGMQCRAILWNPTAGTTEVVGGITGIYPTAITADGVVLGTASDHDGKSIAYLAKLGQRWEGVGTAPGFYATSMNNAGDIIGAVVRHGYEQPWLRRTSGEIVGLPYFDQHGCRPSAISDSGVIVGTAQTDHGTHALVWRLS